MIDVRFRPLKEILYRSFSREDLSLLEREIQRGLESGDLVLDEHLSVTGGSGYRAFLERVRPLFERAVARYTEEHHRALIDYGTLFFDVEL